MSQKEETSSDKIGILSFVPDLWSNIWQSRHHILTGLSDHFKILWVSPPTYFVSWRKGNVFSGLKGRGVRKLNQRMWIYAPRLPADYKIGYRKDSAVADAFRVYHKAWKHAQIYQIKTLLKRLGIKRVLLYVWRPEYHWVVGKFNELALCYHMDDDYGFSPDQDIPISWDEMKLISCADIVFIHSKTLMKKKGEINSNTFYLPNAVDYNRYRRALQSNEPLPSDIEKLHSPRIGYIGYIKRHLDMPLLMTLSKERPEWSIIMIGPIREEHTEIQALVKELDLMPNVYFLGAKPQSEIPFYIKALDVCILPYLQTNYTRYIYPLKLHEYLACGKPIVATPLENLIEYSELIQFAKNQEEWICEIEKALLYDSAEKRELRVKMAQANSWEVRVDRIKELCEKSAQEYFYNQDKSSL